MTYMKLLPLVTDPLLDAIAAGRTYDPYHDDLPELSDAMVAFDTDRATNYIDLMPNLANELMLRRHERDGDGGFDPHGELVSQWCGELFAALAAFEVNQQIA